MPPETLSKSDFQPLTNDDAEDNNISSSSEFFDDSDESDLKELEVTEPSGGGQLPRKSRGAPDVNHFFERTSEKQTCRLCM